LINCVAPPTTDINSREHLAVTNQESEKGADIALTIEHTLMADPYGFYSDWIHLDEE